jgi:hypothetical protein
MTWIDGSPLLTLIFEVGFSYFDRTTGSNSTLFTWFGESNQFTLLSFTDDRIVRPFLISWLAYPHSGKSFSDWFIKHPKDVSYERVRNAGFAPSSGILFSFYERACGGRHGVECDGDGDPGDPSAYSTIRITALCKKWSMTQPR